MIADLAKVTGACMPAAGITARTWNLDMENHGQIRAIEGRHGAPSDAGGPSREQACGGEPSEY